MRLPALLLATMVLLACTSGAPGGEQGQQQTDVQQPQEARAVEFPAADGATLSGLLFGPVDASSVIVMAHEPGGSMDDWVDPAIAAAEQGMAAMTFNLRPGEGAEHPRDADVRADLEAAVAFVRQEAYAQVGLAGAGVSGAAALRLAATEDLAAVVALSPPARLAGRGLRARRVAEPVLLVTAKGDQPYRRHADRLARRLPAAADLHLSGAAHGTEVFSKHPAFVDHVVSWLSERFAAGEPAAPAAPADTQPPAAEQSGAPQPVAPPGG